MLGGFTVREHLAPGFVMAHFCLSMLALIAAVALAWRSAHQPGSRPRATDRLMVWCIRLLLPLGALTIFAGTAATAAGPHAGGSPGPADPSPALRGRRHAELGDPPPRHDRRPVRGRRRRVWFMGRRRGAGERLLEPLTALGVLLAAQGLVGSVQYELKLPSDMVWVHVTLATVTWVALLWAVAEAGRLVPAAAVPAGEPPPSAP